MKKMLSGILILMLALGSVIMPAAAEESAAPDAVTSASINSRDSGAPAGQMPGGQMPGAPMHGMHPHGQRSGGAQQPAAGQAEPSAVPDESNAETGAMPADTGANPQTATPPDANVTGSGTAQAENTPVIRNTRGNKKNGKSTQKKNTATTPAVVPTVTQPTVTFELLLEKGVISQDVYDAIMAFIKDYTAPASSTVPAEGAPAEPANG